METDSTSLHPIASNQSKEKYKEIRELVYFETKKIKRNLNHFFIDTTHDTLLNTKLENYIERIKDDGFYGGIIEIGIISNDSNLNIAVY